MGPSMRPFDCCGIIRKQGLLLGTYAAMGAAIICLSIFYISYWVYARQADLAGIFGLLPLLGINLIPFGLFAVLTYVTTKVSHHPTLAVVSFLFALVQILTASWLYSALLTPPDQHEPNLILSIIPMYMGILALICAAVGTAVGISAKLVSRRLAR